MAKTNSLNDYMNKNLTVIQKKEVMKAMYALWKGKSTINYDLQGERKTKTVRKTKWLEAIQKFKPECNMSDLFGVIS